MSVKYGSLTAMKNRIRRWQKQMLVRGSYAFVSIAENVTWHAYSMKA
jgi:hypothetical protein